MAWRLPWTKKIKPRKRRFEGAVFNRLTRSFAFSERSINTELRGDLDVLRRRSRDLTKNEPLGRRFISLVVKNVCGSTGFRMQSKVMENDTTQDDAANKAIEKSWKDWGRAENCDISGILCWPDIEQLIIKNVARDGENLLRLRHDATNKYNFSVQIYDIERLATTINRESSSTQNAIIMGKEIDGNGKVQWYHIITRMIGRDPLTRETERVPASEIIHLYMSDSAEQMRGIPWMHASMIRIHHLKGFEESAIIAARVGASKMGWIQSPDGSPEPLKEGEDEQGTPYTKVSAGEIGMLPEGYEFVSFNPDYPHAMYEPFVKATKRDIGSGIDVSYHSLANDLEGVNFSSIRAGTLDERDAWMLVQGWFIRQLLNPIFKHWISSALLSGAITNQNGIPLPAAKLKKFEDHEFMGRRWQWVDPLKDINASVTAIEHGIASPYTIAAQQGLDADEVLDDIARFQKRAKEKGVVLGKTPPTLNLPDDDDEPKKDDTKIV